MVSPLRKPGWNVFEVEPKTVVSNISVVFAIPPTESTYALMSVNVPAALSNLNDEFLAATNAILFFLYKRASETWQVNDGVVPPTVYCART